MDASGCSCGSPVPNPKRDEKTRSAPNTHFNYNSRWSKPGESDLYAQWRERHYRQPKNKKVLERVLKEFIKEADDMEYVMKMSEEEVEGAGH